MAGVASSVTDAPTAITPTPPADLPRTLGELRAAGHEYRTVKEELRDNLLDRLRSGAPRFPGIVGYDDTVLPEVERALLAGHDMVLLGERGQGKTRLIRGAGRPARRVDAGDRRLRAATSTRTTRSPRRPAGWPPRSATTAADRLAAPLRAVRREARHPGHQRRRPDRRRRPDQGRRRAAPSATRRPSTSAWCPRTNRGIFAVNELPDLAERIQVSLLNVLEERDIQVRGYQLRLPLDLLLVASANPEDYTNRGPDHHPAQGPVRRRDPHPLPARPRAGDRR